jgi:CelD/BcsL family acetyltransferase involved in cellulose biosynthesis
MIRRIDPITDPQWSQLLDQHPQASIFHTPAWMEALRRTYGYEPVAYVAAASDGRLAGGIPFCRIRSSLTGRRLVSLPFSDHCQPLFEESEDLSQLLSAAREDSRRDRGQYIELRPLVANDSFFASSTGLTSSGSAVIHRLDLCRSKDDVYRGLNKQCLRKIARSSREGLRYEEGRSEDLLEKFYGLLLLTRRRHQLPPQPLVWFRNLIACLGERLKIRVALQDKTPVASIITFSFNKVVTYKYGCSDYRFNPLGGMTMLFWRTIEEAIVERATEFDLGRSDHDTPGLIAFKDHWGATQSTLRYFRYPAPSAQMRARRLFSSTARRLLVRFPDPVLEALGGFLYRHVG